MQTSGYSLQKMAALSDISLDIVLAHFRLKILEQRPNDNNDFKITVKAFLRGGGGKKKV